VAVIPEGALLVPDSVRNLLWVELNEGMLNVLEHVAGNTIVLRKSIPISIGKRGIGKISEGDQKTPVGVYRLTSYLQDKQLDDFYGLGAYPMNYPNAMDAMLGHTGSGIWLHGLPKNLEQRPLLDSDGCVVIDNESLLGLKDTIVEGETLIVLSAESINWVSLQSQIEIRQELQATLEKWRQAWEARDNHAYLAFYADDFSDLHRNKEQWSSYKSRVNNSKSQISLRFSETSMMTDPVRDNLVTVRYYQQYRSNDYSWSGWTEQVWRNTGTQWQILYEGNG